jgi:hypothetical protein
MGEIVVKSYFKNNLIAELSLHCVPVLMVFSDHCFHSVMCVSNALLTPDISEMYVTDASK